MQTSNFQISGGSPRGVSIARSHPRGWEGRELKELAPSWTLIKVAKEGRFDEYKQQYNQMLAGLDAKETFQRLGENSILLCWEVPGDFCHRRLVARWFEEKLHVTVPEV